MGDLWPQEVRDRFAAEAIAWERSIWGFDARGQTIVADSSGALLCRRMPDPAPAGRDWRYDIVRDCYVGLPSPPPIETVALPRRAIALRGEL